MEKIEKLINFLFFNEVLMIIIKDLKKNKKNNDNKNK